MESLRNKKELAQFFTVDQKVQETMCDLLGNSEVGRVLEPSAGSGLLMRAVVKNCRSLDPDCVDGFELDDTVTPCDPSLRIFYGDFFSLSDGKEGTYDSIIGNPPYLAWKNVPSRTRELSRSVKEKYSDKCNLYHLFIDRCIDLLAPGGQMVMIVPKEWLYSTSAAPLRRKMFLSGSVTHLIDLGETKVFPDADVPAVIIFRYLKNAVETVSDDKVLERETLFRMWEWDDSRWEKRRSVFDTRNDSLAIQSSELLSDFKHTVGDFFKVRVGLVSGADKIFDVTDHENLKELKAEGSVIDLLTTKGVRQYIFTGPKGMAQSFDDYGEETRRYLLSHKDQLISRGIRRFDEKNWFEYGAVRNFSSMTPSGKVIYAYNRVRTRTRKPFFIADRMMFSGGLLMMDPIKDLFTGETPDLEKTLSFLNSEKFIDISYQMGLTSGDKVSYQPSTLERCPLFMD